MCSLRNILGSLRKGGGGGARGGGGSGRVNQRVSGSLNQGVSGRRKMRKGGDEDEDD